MTGEERGWVETEIAIMRKDNAQIAANALATCLAERDAAFDLLGELLKRTDVPLSRILNDARALLEGKSCPPSS